MPIPALSQDIIDEILGWLPLASPKDPTKLHHSCSAALVCKAWLVPARRNIFRVLDLVIGHGWASSEDARLPRLLRILESSGDLAGSIREITWSSPYETFYFENEFPGDSLERLSYLTKKFSIMHTFDLSSESRNNAQEMLAILDRMGPELVGCIQRLRLVLNSRDVEDIISISRQLRNLVNLEVTHLSARSPYNAFLRDELLKEHICSLYLKMHVEFLSPAYLCSFLALFPSLVDLTLGQVALKDRSITAASLQAIATPPRLKRLKFMDVMTRDTVAAEVVIEWFKIRTEHSTLEELVVDCEFKGTNVALAVCHSTLRTMNILGTCALFIP
jgi:hypothetical protein